MRYLLPLILLAFPVWAQDNVTVEACLTKSRAVKVDSPLKFVQAQKEAFAACMATAIPDKQRRELALLNNVQAHCNDDVKSQLTNDPLTTTYEQGEIFRKCMARRNYVVQ